MSKLPLFQRGYALPILWENAHFTVINKPSGLASHPGRHTTDSVESRFIPQKRGGPWLVHRLDTETAGCLLIAKRKTALITAQKSFEQRQTKKIYWAIVKGKPAQESGTITTDLRRKRKPQGWHMEPCSANDKDTLTAHTSWRLLNHKDGLSWLELTLHTGRTHQARVHCASMGNPILGDTLYGRTTPYNGPMLLLARSFTVSLETTYITAQAPPEPDMATVLNTMTIP